MNRKNGPWTVQSETTVFENPWIRVIDHAVIHPNAEQGEYGVVRFKNIAIGVLPIDEQGNVWLVGQHRFPHNRYSWELPEGGGPVDIDPLASAQRELKEETGLTAANWEELSAFDISNSVTDERAICYFAWGLSFGAASPEASEELTVKKVSFASLLEKVINGEISDSLTINMTLMAQAKALRGLAPAPISRHIVDAARQT